MLSAVIMLLLQAATHSIKTESEDSIIIHDPAVRKCQRSEKHLKKKKSEYPNKIKNKSPYKIK